MKYVVHPNNRILAMSNVRGRYVKNPGQLPFSFYFSSGYGVNHGPRVKPMFNPEKLIASLTGTLELCDNWAFVPGRDDSGVSQKLVDQMKRFFREHLVLFCLVWDEHMQDATLEDYFRGHISFQDMVQDIDFYGTHKDVMSNLQSVSQLEKFCRDHNLVNMYGN